MDINAKEKEWKQKLEIEEKRIAQEREALGQYEIEAEKEVRNIEANFEEAKEEVVQMLLKKVMDVNLIVPEVVVANFDKLALNA